MIIDMPTVSMGSSGSLITADRVAYDNSTSGLESTNVQDAMDEISSDLVVEDISADLQAHINATFGTVTVTGGKRFGNVVSITLACGNTVGAEEGTDVVQFVLSKYRPIGNQIYSYSISQYTILACFLRGKDNPNQTAGVRAMYKSYTANNTINLDFTYITDDF